MKVKIMLLCGGRQDNGFHFCSGVENTILDLENIKHTENYKNLVMYLDRVPKLFDGSCIISHIISNAIYKIYEMGYIDEELYKRISNFYNFHKACGLILKLEIK